MIMKCNMIIRVTWSFHVFSWHVSTHLLRKAASGFAVAKAAPAIAPLVRPRAAPEAAPPAAPASCGECGLQHHGRDPPTGFSCQRWDDVPSVQCSEFECNVCDCKCSNAFTIIGYQFCPFYSFLLIALRSKPNQWFQRHPKLRHCQLQPQHRWQLPPEHQQWCPDHAAKEHKHSQHKLTSHLVNNIQSSTTGGV